jgi:diaminopimelate decarboxylase
MTETLRSLRHAFGDAPHLVAYAIKANSAGTVVRAFAAEGSGVDAVSGAELELSLACGVPAKQVVMSGVAKTDAEIDLALFKGILAIQAESVEELTRIEARARAAGRRFAARESRKRDRLSFAHRHRPRRCQVRHQ